MKSYLLAAALLLATPALAQKTSRSQRHESATLFRGANAIMIHTEEEKDIAFKHLAVAMVSQGYLIDSLNEYIVVTKPKGYEFKRSFIITPVTHKFRATYNGSALILTGLIRGNSNRIGQFFEVGMGWYGEKEHTQDEACFSQAQKIAAAYPNGRLTYLKQP